MKLFYILATLPLLTIAATIVSRDHPAVAARQLTVDDLKRRAAGVVARDGGDDGYDDNGGYGDVDHGHGKEDGDYDYDQDDHDHGDDDDGHKKKKHHPHPSKIYYPRATPIA